MAPSPTILHADLDAFYASVEQVLDPSLRGKPIAVGSGVVLASSYEAKRFGVSSGMSGFRARQLCPTLQFVSGHFKKYRQLGDQVIGILEDFTPDVQRISIDEAFLDVTGSVHLFGPPEAIGAAIRQRVRDEVGLPISVGAASNKHLAKIASQVAKPDGLVVVPPERELEFLHPLPVGLVWGIGPVTQAKLAERGVRTIGELAGSSDDALGSLLGRALGAKVGALARNDDRRKVRPGGRAGSVGSQSAFGRRDVDERLVREVLGHLADRVAGRLRAKGRAGRTVTVRLRFLVPGGPGRSITRSHTLPEPVCTTLTLAEVAEWLVWQGLADHPQETQISLLGISVSNFEDQAVLQLALPAVAESPTRPGSPLGAARWAVDRAVDRVRERFGRSAVGYAGVALGLRSHVPDEFRELAEKDP